MKLRAVRARAPLRLGFAGGGTDVSPFCDVYGGVVLNATISRYASVTMRPRTDGRLVLHAADLQQAWEGEALPQVPIGDRLSLLKGVYNRIVREFTDGEPLSLTITTHTDSPPGSGLGTSSALVVTLVQAFREMLDLPLGTYEIARLAFEIERQDLELAGGRQDQYAAAFGGVNFMEFGAEDRVLVNPLRIDRRTLSEFESSLVLYFTGVSRDSASIIDQQSRNIAENNSDAVEAMKLLREDGYAMKEALLRGDLHRFASVMGESWQHKRRSAKGVANPLIDEIYDLAMTSGALGGKISGAGGGGFMIFMVEPTRRPDLMRALAQREGTLFNAAITEVGSESWRIS